jgi:hypothetical protein
MIVPAILGLAMLGMPVVAATAATTGASHEERNTYMNGPMTAPQECQFFQNRFDLGIKVHADAPKAKQAMDLRAEGVRLCGAGKAPEGVAKLKQALNDIGVSTVED